MHSSDLRRLFDSAAGPVVSEFFVDFTRQDDFGSVAAGTSVDGGGAFLSTVVGSGTMTRPTQPYVGGWARLSGAATTDNSGINAQSIPFVWMAKDKTATFKARAILNESTSTNAATESDLLLGFSAAGTGLIASAPNDGIFFRKDDGGTNLVAVIRAGGSDIATQTVATFDKTVHTYGIQVDITSVASTTPTGNVTFTIDGVPVARFTSKQLPATTVPMAVTIAYQTGDNTGTKWIDLDYIGGLQLR